MDHPKNFVSLSFDCEMDDRTEWEIRQKGYFEHSLVNLPDGRTMRVFFWEPVRLLQDLEMDLSAGRTCLAEPGMIVLPELTIKNMKAAVEELYERGYFNSFAPVEPISSP